MTINVVSIVAVKNDDQQKRWIGSVFRNREPVDSELISGKIRYYAKWLDSWLSRYEYTIRIESLGVDIQYLDDNTYILTASRQYLDVFNVRLGLPYQHDMIKWIDWHIVNSMMAACADGVCGLVVIKVIPLEVNS